MFKQLLIVVAFAATTAQAQTVQSPFKGESEASAIVVSGNVDTETYGAKTKNMWLFSENDLALIFGSYLQSKSAGTETAKAWTAGLRYDHTFIKDELTGFVQHMAEHDPYNGVFIQRNSSDIGAKYYFVKNDNLMWLGEFGYRYSSIYQGVRPNAAGVSVVEDYNVNYLRGFTEVSNKFNAAVSGKLWFEYLSDLEHSDRSLWNTEASVSVVMTSILSLKTAYLVNHNEGAISPLKKDTTTWTTALVANY
jgi:putative salt-induced outer membrane protein